LFVAAGVDEGLSALAMAVQNGSQLDKLRDSARYFILHFLLLWFALIANHQHLAILCTISTLDNDISLILQHVAPGAYGSWGRWNEQWLELHLKLRRRLVFRSTAVACAQLRVRLGSGFGFGEA
jgi:hypothetical protein